MRSVIHFKPVGAKAAVLLLLAVCLPWLENPASAALSVDLATPRIGIHFFYHGTTVRVSGTSGKGEDIVIKIVSCQDHEVLRTKGKVGGVLWMNVGQITFDNIPSFYTVTGSRNPEEVFLPETACEPYAIGYPCLRKKARIDGSDPGSNEKWMTEFIELKKSAGLYSISSGHVKTEEKGEVQSFRAEIPWPPQAVPGEYTLSVYAVKNGIVTDAAEKKLVVEQEGFVKFLADLARHRAREYGILSILVALVSGLAVGLIFHNARSTEE